jgi:hypothetical protein
VNGVGVRIKATEMVGVRLTTKEIRWLLDALAEGKVGPGEGPEIVALHLVMSGAAAAAAGVFGKLPAA